MLLVRIVRNHEDVLPYRWQSSPSKVNHKDSSSNGGRRPPPYSVASPNNLKHFLLLSVFAFPTAQRRQQQQQQQQQQQHQSLRHTSSRLPNCRVCCCRFGRLSVFAFQRLNNINSVCCLLFVAAAAAAASLCWPMKVSCWHVTCVT